MNNVNYLKLSEQYASFLVAVGGVSITVLTLVLSLGPDSGRPAEVNIRSFLVAALVVATVTCFIGAHMMAETAAFIERNPIPTSSGKRLFLYASINIFIAIILVLFALMLLPTSSGRVHIASLAPISVGVFVLVIAVAVYWMILAGKRRMDVPRCGKAIWVPLAVACAAGFTLCLLPIPKRCLLLIAFAPSTLSTVFSLGWFATIFRKDDTLRLHEPRIQDMWFFSVAINITYAALVVAGLKTMME
jgi:hypothetical protein